MKVYLVEFTFYNGWGEILKRFNLKCYKSRDSANHYIYDEARRYARLGFSVSIVNDGLYIDRVRAERKNTKVMKREIYEICVKEMEVI